MDTEYVSEEELHGAFQSFFGAGWYDVLDVAEKSFAYNTGNDAYLAVRHLRFLENLTLERLLEDKGIVHSPNVIVS